MRGAKLVFLSLLFTIVILSSVQALPDCSEYQPPTQITYSFGTEQCTYGNFELHACTSGGQTYRYCVPLFYAPYLYEQIRDETYLSASCSVGDSSIERKFFGGTGIGDCPISTRRVSSISVQDPFENFPIVTFGNYWPGYSSLYEFSSLDVNYCCPEESLWIQYSAGFPNYRYCSTSSSNYAPCPSGQVCNNNACYPSSMFGCQTSIVCPDGRSPYLAPTNLCGYGYAKVDSCANDRYAYCCYNMGRSPNYPSCSTASDCSIYETCTFEGQCVPKPDVEVCSQITWADTDVGEAVCMDGTNVLYKCLGFGVQAVDCDVDPYGTKYSSYLGEERLCVGDLEDGKGRCAFVNETCLNTWPYHPDNYDWLGDYKPLSYWQQTGIHAGYIPVPGDKACSGRLNYSGDGIEGIFLTTCEIEGQVTSSTCPTGYKCLADSDNLNAQCVLKPAEERCQDVMTWLTDPLPQIGQKSCDPSVTNIFYTCNADGTTTKTNCGIGDICRNDGLNAYCQAQIVPSCGDCSINSNCVYGTSCKSTLDGNKLCVPDGSCATGVGGSTCSSTTYQCKDGMKYTCNTETGIWSAGLLNSPECNSFSAYWSNDGLQMLSIVYEGTSATRYFSDSSKSYTGTVTFSGAGGYQTKTMTNGATVFATGLSNIQVGEYIFTGATSLGQASAILNVIKPECGNRIIEGLEQCDNGTAVNTNTCIAAYNTPCTYCSNGNDGNTACTIVTLPAEGYPGDGICQAAYESCSHPDCINSPICANCGDGVKQPSEECDLGSSLNGVVCSAPYGESCEYCSSACTKIIVSGGNCSDGIKNSDERGIDCGGEKCENACLPETTELICSDYKNQTACQNYDPYVASNSVQITRPSIEEAMCDWNGSACFGAIRYTSGGSDIGTCVYVQSQTQDNCDDGFLTYSYTGRFDWAPNNKVPSYINASYVYGSDGYYHFDPERLASACSSTSGSKPIPCPAQVQLNYFTWKNFVGAILIIVIIYLLANLKKKKQKTKSNKEKAPMNKSTKKKTVKKKIVKKK